jgi:hypothetical protein
LMKTQYLKKLLKRLYQSFKLMIQTVLLLGQFYVMFQELNLIKFIKDWILL